MIHPDGWYTYNITANLTFCVEIQFSNLLGDEDVTSQLNSHVFLFEGERDGCVRGWGLRAAQI